jgi:hypothetical protein
MTTEQTTDAAGLSCPVLSEGRKKVLQTAVCVT